MHQSPMNHLKGGDTYLNKWLVPAIPFGQLMKVPQAVADKMFIEKEVTALVDGDDDVEMSGATSDELALDQDMAIPFPHEHHYQLGMELIHVFGVDVLILTSVGSGELMQAVLAKHKYGIGFCNTQTQKKQTMTKLKKSRC